MTDETEPPAGVAQHFEDAYMHAPVGRASLTPEGTIVRGNYTFADLVGRPFVDLEGAVLGEIAPALATALGETTTEHEIETEQRGGATQRLRVTVAPMRAEDGRIVGYDLYATDLTELRAAEAEIRRAEQEFRALIAHSSDIITVLEADGTWRSSSAAGTRMLGFPEGYDPPGGIFSVLHPDDLEPARRAFDEIIAGTRTPDDLIVVRARSADGSRYLYFETVGRNLLHDPAFRGIVVTSRDVTEREAAERQAARLLEVLERSIQVVVLSDTSGEVVWANTRAREILLGTKHNVAELSTVESRERLRDVVMPFVRRHGIWTGELALRSSTGDEVPVIATVQGHREEGDIVLVSTIAHDITELKAAQNRLQYEATHDPLTALPNRAMLQEVGEQALGRAARRGSTTAVLFLDLDHFKEVNDTLGHDAGDRVLVELAQRLRVGVRTGDLVARLGGDEFCVLCEGVESDDEVLDLGQRICDVVSIPISALGREVQIGTSVGIAVDVGGQASMGGLLRNADIALYRAKRSGRSKVAVFDEASMSSDDEILEYLDPRLG